ncbi:MAG: SGNH/GDSL hydrolase family protein [Proteobacteria bacterium]|nr:SGNH/GDSL hydrolase family protein [Pseudomonadota bacterium]MBU1743119.1 SGNH/GDSL hydrolase family protein [Pseudomonadota bacterium]
MAQDEPDDRRPGDADQPEPVKIPRPRMGRPRRGCLGRLALVLISLILALVAAEVIVRLVLPAPPLLGRFDPLLGLSLSPGTEGWWRREHTAHVKINSLGHRDVERGWKRDAKGNWIKPPGTRRILLLGDSFVEALQVDLTKTLGQILERSLRAQGDWRMFNWEVVNAGLSGMGTTHEYLLLKHRGFHFRPDIVILFVCLRNDLLDSSPEYGNTERPHVTLQNGRLVVDTGFKDRGLNRVRRSWWGRILYWLIPRSHILRWINEKKYEIIVAVKRLFGGGKAGEPLGRRRETGAEAADKSFYLRLVPFTRFGWQFAELPLDYLELLAFTERMWRVTERVLLEMNRLCRTRGVKFLVVLIPLPEQVDAGLRVAWRRDNPTLDLNLVENGFIDICRRHRIPVFSLRPGLIRVTKDQGGELYRYGSVDAPKYGHFTVRGHAVVARRLLDYLDRRHRDWIRPPK